MENPFKNSVATILCDGTAGRLRQFELASGAGDVIFSFTFNDEGLNYADDTDYWEGFVLNGEHYDLNVFIPGEHHLQPLVSVHKQIKLESSEFDLYYTPVNESNGRKIENVEYYVINWRN